MRKVLVFLSFLALVVALPAGAQTQHNVVARVYDITVKPGMSPQWEAGVKKLNQWAHQHNLPLTYYYWNVISGPKTGEYVIGTFDHAWKDFDEDSSLGPAIGKEIQADMGPYTQSVEARYWVYRTDLTGHPENPGQTPTKFTSITTYVIKPVDSAGMVDAIKKANAAIQKSHWPGKPASWFALVNGGEEPTFLLAVNLKNWADFQPPATSFGQMLNNVYGKEGAAAIGKEVGNALMSMQTEILRYRPDLSYIANSH